MPRGNSIQPIRSSTQIWVVTRHQYGISTLVFQTSFGEETIGSVAKCRLQAILRRNSTSYSVSNIFAAGCLIEVFFKEGEFHTSALYPCKVIQDSLSLTQIWVVTRHQYGISTLVSQTSFGGETSAGVTKCWLFSKASFITISIY